MIWKPLSGWKSSLLSPSGEPKIHRFGQLGPKIYQVGVQNHSKSAPGGFLEGSWHHLGSKMPSRANKFPTCQQKLHFWGGQVGAPDHQKTIPRAIQKVIIFLIDLGIDFWTDLVPTWDHLGPQRGPSWLQNRSKLGC